MNRHVGSALARKFSTTQRCEVIAIACDHPARCDTDDAQVWTLDLLVRAVEREAGFTMSRSSVHRTLTRNALRPHRVEMWLHSRDPDFRSKTNRIVDLYQDPPEDILVLCIDEKTGVQATERIHPFTPAQPGRPGRFEFQYVRHGTTSLLAAFNTVSGRVTSSLGPTRKGEDLMAFMEQVAAEYRKAPRIVVIWDNLNIHHDGADKRWTTFNERHGRKFEFVYTPLHASWLNQVEIFFSILARRCLRYGSFKSVAELESTISRFIARWNVDDGHPFNWSFGAIPCKRWQHSMADNYALNTVAQWLAQNNLSHLHVLGRGTHLVVYPEEQGEKWNRVRFTHLGGPTYQLGMADHHGKWDQTPFTGSLNELLSLVATDFAWKLTDA